MRQKRDMTIFQAKRFRNALRSRVTSNLHDFAFSEVVTSSVRTKLHHFFTEARKITAVDQLFEPVSKCIVSIVVTNV